MPVFETCSHFAVNVLTVEQVAVSNRFATPGLDKFDGIEWSAGIGDAPVLAHTSAVFECSCEARHDGGDHVILIGRVERFSHGELAPLIFHAGRYCSRAELPPITGKH